MSLSYKQNYRRNLPHLQPAGAFFFLTFRLAGSLPQSVVRQYKREQQWLAHLARKNPELYDQVKEEFERAWFHKFESILDGEETGPLWLKNGNVADIIAEALHHRDGKLYRLDAFTIMANHVHTVVKPLPKREFGRSFFDAKTDARTADDIEYHSLAAIMHSLKGYTAFKANKLLGRDGEF